MTVLSWLVFVYTKFVSYIILIDLKGYKNDSLLQTRQKDYDDKAYGKEFFNHFSKVIRLNHPCSDICHNSLQLTRL